MDPEFVRKLMDQCRENILTGNWHNRIVVGDNRQAMDLADCGFATLELPAVPDDRLHAYGHSRMPIKGGPQHYVVKLTDAGFSVLVP